MTQIVKYLDKEIEAVEKIEPQYRPYIMALMDSKITTLQNVDAGNTIYDIIKVAEYDSGLTKLNNEDLIVLAKSTHDLITEKYPNLTISEFRTACKNGTLNDYGEWYGICLKTLVQWIKGYLSTEGRAKAIKEWNAKIDSQKFSNVPVAALLEYTKQGALKAFERYKTTGNLPIGAFAYYDVINEIIGQEFNGVKTLVTDPVERKRIKREVKEKMTQASLKEKMISEQKGNFAQAEELMVNILEGFKGKLENEYKTEFLRYYFDQLIKENKPLKL